MKFLELAMKTIVFLILTLLVVTGILTVMCVIFGLATLCLPWAPLWFQVYATCWLILFVVIAKA